MLRTAAISSLPSEQPSAYGEGNTLADVSLTEEALVAQWLVFIGNIRVYHCSESQFHRNPLARIPQVVALQIEFSLKFLTQL
ncbi:hypothetical protein NPIL_407511 [Nephila pilipes]|uniref:Uncharacterized protein n=1 Tax=Nephila pilipes TaxID=299642 RepID=A0A8X6PB41_NEPPI|nr:hypothetical protein NPIL_407511 [Nephila pilipes]